MRAPNIQAGRGEKVNTGWFGGCNSVRTPWLLSDNQYRWGENIVNRGGIVQTRYGYKMVVSLPEGNLQGFTIFKATKDRDNIQQYAVVAVDGKVYALPFPLFQPPDWEVYRLKNITFKPDAKNVYWAATKKSFSSSSTGTLNIVPTYSVLMMQDGISSAAYFDGFENGQLDEDSLQTPRGSWMAWSGNRLWVAREDTVIAGDLADPLSFQERVSLTSQSRGDFRFDDEITGLTTSLGDNRQANLIVFTENDTSSLLASILDREQWFSTPNFKSVIYPSIGCSAGRSIVNHAGLLWWYTYSGLISSDSAAAAFLTSQVNHKDVEMAQSKRNFALDISNICSTSFESYLLVSVPSGDTFNSHTMALDYAISDELNQDLPPAWSGVWTGIRPVEWASGTFDGQRKLYCASKDYFPVEGTTNHIWETFRPERYDSFKRTDSDGVRRDIQRPIYCSFETKLLGDSMDLKTFKFAEADLTEIGGEVNLKISFAGDKGGYRDIFNQKIIATLDAEATGSDEVVALRIEEGSFKVQGRRVRTSTPLININDVSVESRYGDTISKAFSLYFQWCGRMGIEACRFFTEPKEEPINGECRPDETGFNIVTQDGESFRVV